MALASPEQVLNNFHDDNYQITGLKINQVSMDAPIETFDTVYGHYIALEQFITSLNFAIEYDLFTNNMKGWIYDPKNTFLYEHNTRQFTVGKKKITIPADNIVIYQNELFIEISYITEIFNITYNYQPQKLILQLYSKQKTPVEIQYDIDQRLQLLSVGQAGGKKREVVADYAFDYEAFSMPLLEAKLNLSYDFEDSSIDESSNEEYDSSLEAYIRNHMFYMQSKLYINNNLDNDNDNDKRIFLLSRYSRKDEYFSPLKLSALELGDISGNVGNGMGFKISNDTGAATLTFDEIDIRGTGYSGWTVELYVNNILISSQLIDDEGRYTFEDVALTYGNNYVEILKYGPHGETEKEVRNYNIDDNLLKSNHLVFDIEYIAKDQFLLGEDAEDSDDNYYLKFGRRISDTNSIFYEHTFEYGQEDSDTVTLISSIFDAANFLSYSKDYFANKEIYDFESLFDLMNDTLEISLNYKYEKYEDYYNQSISYDISKDFYNTAVSFESTLSRYFSAEDYYYSQEYHFDFSTLLPFNIKLYNNLDYTFDNQDHESVATAQTTFNHITPRKIYSASLNHDVYPDLQMASASFNYYQKLEKAFSYNLIYSYSSDDWSVKNILTKDFKIIFKLGAFVDYHNFENEVILGLNLDINGSLFIAPNPYSRSKIGTALNVNTASGVLGIRAFIDEDANNIFNDGDTPLQGVKFTGITNEFATNSNGFTYLTNMSSRHVYSIVTDYNTMPTTDVVARKEPLYVSVVPSKVNYVDVVFSYLGSIDGNLYIKNQPLSRVEMELRTGDGELIDTFMTEDDGFFYFPDIPAGKYLLEIAENSYKKYYMQKKLSFPIEITKDNLFIEYLKIDLSKYVSRKVRNFYDRKRSGKTTTAFGTNYTKEDLLKIIPVAKTEPKVFYRHLIFGKNNNSKGIYEVKIAESLSKKAIINIMNNLKQTYPQTFYALNLKIRTKDEEQDHIYKLKTPTGISQRQAIKHCKQLYKQNISCIIQKEFSLGKFQTKYDLLNYKRQIIMPLDDKHQKMLIKRNIEETSDELNTNDLGNNSLITYLGGVNYELIITENRLINRSIESFCYKNRKTVNCKMNYIATNSISKEKPELDEIDEGVIVDIYDLEDQDEVFYQLFIGEFKDIDESYKFCNSIGITKNKCDIYNRLTDLKEYAILQ